VKFDYFSLSGQNRSDWETLCPLNSYVVVEPAAFGFPIPKSLLQKSYKIVVACSGYFDNEITFYMANLLRIDGSEIDQNPFGFAFLGPTATTSGYLIQHGNWINRTTPLTIDRTIDFGNFLGSPNFIVQGIPEHPTGKLSDLQIASHRNAFTILNERIKIDIER